MSMKAKMLEVRDRGTFIPVLAIEMNSAFEGDRYLLGRAGFDPNGDLVQLVYLASGKSYYDPYDWTGSRTMQVAHQYIQENFYKLVSGEVICVEYILGERSEPKISERYD